MGRGGWRRRGGHYASSDRAAVAAEEVFCTLREFFRGGGEEEGVFRVKGRAGCEWRREAARVLRGDDCGGNGVSAG